MSLGEIKISICQCIGKLVVGENSADRMIEEDACLDGRIPTHLDIERVGEIVHTLARGDGSTRMSVKRACCSSERKPCSFFCS